MRIDKLIQKDEALIIYELITKIGIDRLLFSAQTSTRVIERRCAWTHINAHKRSFLQTIATIHGYDGCKFGLLCL